MVAKNSSSFLQGMIAGIIVGVLISIAMIFITREPVSKAPERNTGHPATPSTPAAPSPRVENSNQGSGMQTTKDSQYDFYKILPQGDSPASQPSQGNTADLPSPSSQAVITPPADVPPKEQETANLSPPKPLPEKIPEQEKKADAGRYWIQAGAFRSKSDAERTKARLAFLGLEAKTTTAEGWYRVRLGPLDYQQAAQLRKKITQNGMEAHLIKEN